MGRNQIIVVIVILVILAIGGYLLLKNQNSDSVATLPADDSISVGSSAAPSDNTDTTSPAASATPSASGTETVKEFTVTGSSFKFDPATITVNKGDKVKITFKNSGGTHNLVIDEYNVKTQVLPAEGTETVEFTADQTGNFEYYCGVGNHRAMGMKGTLIVK